MNAIPYTLKYNWVVMPSYGSSYNVVALGRAILLAYILPLFTVASTRVEARRAATVCRAVVAEVFVSLVVEILAAVGL